MNASPKSGHKYIYLDVARGLAALVVTLGHLRQFVFVDYNSAGNVGIFWKSFYFLTGLGHEAVMVFFVLSGFLIGKNVYDLHRSGQWSFVDYAIKRLSRLWIVLIPALVLTALWDGLGRHFFGGGLYTGALNHMYLSTPSTLEATQVYRPETFVGNALFLHTIVVPTFGTNSALWSLANEFWYYVLFPLGFFALRGDAPLHVRLILAVLGVGICLLLPPNLLLYGLIWLFGFGVVLVSQGINLTWSPRSMRVAAAIVLALFLATLAAGRVMDQRVADFLIALVFAVLLFFLSQFGTGNRLVKSVAGFLSEISYTLYLTHLPFLAFLATSLLSEHRFQPGLASLAVYAALAATTLAYAFLVYLLFERHTKNLQSILMRRLHPSFGK